LLVFFPFLINNILIYCYKVYYKLIKKEKKLEQGKSSVYMTNEALTLLHSKEEGYDYGLLSNV